MPALLDRTTDALEAIAAAGLTALQAEVAHIMAVVRNKLADMDVRLEDMSDADIPIFVSCGSATPSCHIPGLSRVSVPPLFREPKQGSVG